MIGFDSVAGVPDGSSDGHDDVRGHDRVDAAADRGPERRGVDAVPLRAGVVDDRHAVVAVGRRVAVPREVLGGGGDVGALVAVDAGRHQ